MTSGIEGTQVVDFNSIVKIFTDEFDSNPYRFAASCHLSDVYWTEVVRCILEAEHKGRIYRSRTNQNSSSTLVAPSAVAQMQTESILTAIRTVSRAGSQPSQTHRRRARTSLQTSRKTSNL